MALARIDGLSDVNPGAWTIEALKEYFEKQLESLDKRYDERTDAAMAATEKAAGALEARLNLLNELRGEVLTRTEYDAKHVDLDRRLQQLERWRANITGRAVAMALVGAIFIAVVTGLITHLIQS